LNLYKIQFLRFIFLRILRIFKNIDINIKHHWVIAKIRINIFQHKGYWYHKKNREKDTINMFYKVIDANDIVFDIGSHIGYMSVIFASIAKYGKVVCFEPNAESFKYLYDNTKAFSNCNLEKLAISDTNGAVDFYTENLTGQNSSLVKNFQGLVSNINHSQLKNVQIKTVRVTQISIDEYCTKNNIYPDFLKIDIEGNELRALIGAKKTLKMTQSNIMVEINNNKDTSEIFAFLNSTSKCNFLFPKEYIIWSSKSKTFPWPII